MVKYVSKGDSLIAKKSKVQARKLDFKGLRKHPILNKNMTLYECSRNSKVTVVEEYTGNREGIEHYYNKKNDCLEADSISVYCNSIRKEKLYVESGVTGRHNAQFMHLKKMNVSTIKYPLKNIRQIIINDKIKELK